jgi:pimeloyl-ACP methyl ester carboxylesterase
MFLTVVACCAGALLAMALVQAFCVWLDGRKYPPPGRMVNVARTGAAQSSAGQSHALRLHVVKQGEGSPAVVLESGIATSSLNWKLLQPTVATFAATYSYDRAGLGWSDSEAGKITVRMLVENLHALLQNLELPAPYILVGHSFGGYIVRSYAESYPQEVAGVVMVDPLTPEEWVAPTPAQMRLIRKAARIARILGVFAALGVVRFVFWLLHRGSKASSGRVVSFFGAGAASVAQRIETEINKLPQEVIQVVRMQWSRSKPFWTFANYLDGLPACAREVMPISIPATVPVTVISGNQQPPERLAEHEAIAKKSLHGKHILAGRSGHWIQFDEPEFIENAIREIAGFYDMKASRDKG